MSKLEHLLKIRAARPDDAEVLTGIDADSWPAPLATTLEQWRARLEVFPEGQLVLEYDPLPPFECGHPRTAAPETHAAAKALMLDFPQRAAAIGKASLEARNTAA